MNLSLRTLADSFYACIRVTNAPGTVEYYRRLIERFITHVGVIPIARLKPPHLSAWATTWHQVQAVQRLFNWACNEADMLKSNPFKKVKKPRPGRRKRTLQPAQVLALLRNSRHDFRRYLLAIRESLARPQEIRALHWEHLHAVNPDESPLQALASGRAIFVLDAYKSQSRRLDPQRPRILLISRRFGRLLSRLAARCAELSGPIFLRDDGRPWNNNAVRLRMRRLRRRCGFRPDHRGENIVCYTLRHTQATRATARGVRDRTLADLLGHTSTRTTARYQHLETAHLWEAFDQLSTDRRKVA